MSLSVFCPHAGCGAKASYEAVKPTHCPICKRAFADAFKPIAPPMAPAGPTTTDDIDLTPSDRPLTKSALLKARNQRSSARAKPRTPHSQRDEEAETTAHIMNAPAAEDAPVFPDDGGDDDLDPREVRRRARELAARISPDSIRLVEGTVDGKRSRSEIVRLEDLMRQ